MTILEMFEREDIYGILEKTMHEYFLEVHQKDVSVAVSKSHISKRLLIYPRLGIVVSHCPSWAVIKRTFVSFDVQGNLPKKLFAWAYITLCFLTFGLLADASLRLSDYSLWTRGMVVVPSNRKIRIYRYDKGYVDSILKVGFNDYYFKKELKVRAHPQYDFILGVMASGDRWYREELLRGRCLVRVSLDRYGSYMKKVISDLKLFYSHHTREVTVGLYIEQMAREYDEKLMKIEASKHILCGDKIRRVISLVRDNYGKADDVIAITLTHGDLQTGNIYLDEKADKIYIIDWETIKERSIWYDSATVLCETRRKDKFSAMVNSRHNAVVKDNILKFDQTKQRDMNLVAGVLVLEELGFFLDEIIDLSGEMGAEIIERYEYEIDHIDWSTFTYEKNNVCHSRPRI